MAPKRLASSSPLQKSKKAKLPTSQKSLDVFFPPPSKDASARASSSKPDVSHPSRDRQDRELNQDRELAERLASNDGIDLETAKRLEDAWSKHSRVDQGETNNTIAVGSSPASSSGIPGHLHVSALTIDSDRPGWSSGSRKSKCQPSVPTSFRSINVSCPPSASHPDYTPLDVDPMAFDVHGNPPWPPDTPAPYSFLAHALSTLSRTRSRIQILNALTNCLRLITYYHPQSLLPSLYLLSNSLSPPYSPLELGLGPSNISKAIQQIYGLTPVALSKLYKTYGDPGDVAYAAKTAVRTLVPHAPLSISGVYEVLLQISRTQGQGAGKQKQSLVEKLLVSAKGEEPRYLVRTLFQNLRVGAVRTTILSALARAWVLTRPAGSEPKSSLTYAPPETLNRIHPLLSGGKKKANSDPARQEVIEMFSNAEALVRRCYVQHPNFNNIVTALLETGLEGLADRVCPTVGIPLLPTLGSPTRSLDEVYERLDGLHFTAEFKYDGQRAQLHASRDGTGIVTVKLFSRHLEDMTEKYPDIIALTELMFASNTDLSSFVMDAEIVAVDRETNALKSFQDLSQRARKDVRLEEVKVAVCLFAFDLMYLNEQVLLEVPFRRRRHLLRQHFPPITPEAVTVARLGHVESCESEAGRPAVEAFWQKAVEGRSEGLMVKLLDSGEVLEMDSPSKNGKTRKNLKPLPATYEPDKRTSAWLKLKKDYVLGLGDSLDMVPIGAWHGNGRKKDWWSPVLLGLWDSSSEEYVAVCKCMSGFSDIFYKAMKERFAEDSDTCSKTPLWDCKMGGYKPSVYFKPQEVWEIRGADITLSPVSVAALGLVPGSRGLSLRFPRFVKLRDDKGLDQASTPEFLANMWRAQESRGERPTGKEADESELIDVDLDSEAFDEDNEDSS